MDVQINAITEKYQGAGVFCTELTDYNVLMRYLMSVVIFGHFQRPSVATNMTMNEFIRAKRASDGRVVVLVSDHKTGAQGPVQIALEASHHKLFSLYAKR